MLIKMTALAKQFEFLIELDKLKTVLRQNKLIDDTDRRENDAEHSWHIALYAMVLDEYMDDPEFDRLRVLKMLLIHDVVEIDAGDVFAYDLAGRQQQQQLEIAAATRIFGLLPEKQAQELRALWGEYEAGETIEAKWAKALDVLQPFMQNYHHGDGGTWRTFKVNKEQVLRRMAPVKTCSKILWAEVLRMIDTAIDDGYISVEE
jgi:putative hydrolase of HD superfamily